MIISLNDAVLIQRGEKTVTSQMKRKSRFFVVVLSCLTVLIGFTREQSFSMVSRFGDPFPSYEFSMPSSSEDRTYLGISEGDAFTIGDIEADLIVLEVISIYCASCQMQAPIYNEVFELVRKDPTMGDRVKWMGVGVGNNEREVESFRKMKNIPFPLVPDVSFDFYDAIGGPGGIRTPFTLLVRRDEKGRGIVVDSHVGMRHEKEEILEGIRAALQYDLAYLKIEEGERALLPSGERLKPPLSDEKLLQKIRRGMAVSGGVVEEIRRIPPDDEFLYMGTVRAGGEKRQLFAKVVSRPPVCDICHDIHFIYVFDGAGEIVNFVPIHLTKNGNIIWNQKDIEAMKSRLVGRSLLQPFRFNRDVDSVSRATITSVVIFYSMDRGKEVYNELLKRKYVQ